MKDTVTTTMTTATTITFWSRVSGIARVAYAVRSEEVVSYRVDGTRLTVQYGNGHTAAFEIKFGSRVIEENVART